jgi:hypothetical protein
MKVKLDELIGRREKKLRELELLNFEIENFVDAEWEEIYFDIVSDSYCGVYGIDLESGYRITIADNEQEAERCINYIDFTSRKDMERVIDYLVDIAQTVFDK